MMRPRHYAAICKALPTREERNAYLLTTPLAYREMIKTHVINSFEMDKYSRKVR